jgi:3-phenylpropionate/cinnamic acid dioxygenase small subunit
MKQTTPADFLEIERFLLEEAAILEEGRFDAWLDLLSEDVRYVMPVRRSVQPGTGKTIAGSGEETFALFDDDKASLTLRVERLKTGSAHAEVPPSTTQRLITNIRVENDADDATVVVHSRFFIYQERQGRYAATFVGKRRDLLRRAGGSWKIANRRIELAQTILPTTISILL